MGTYQGIQLELDEIKQCIKKQERNAKTSLKTALQTRSFLQPMAILSAIFVFVGSCGNDTILYYGPTIFSQLSLSSLPSGHLAALPWVGFTVGYALSSPLMARMNRVPQFVSCNSVMSVSLFCLSGLLVLLQTGLLLALLLACVAYGLGVGAVPYTMIGEVFPPQYRTLGSCLAQVVRTTTVFLIVKMTPSIITSFGLQSLFLFHGMVCALAAVFASAFLPETRGK